MLRWLWDLLFVRSQWNIIDTVHVYKKEGDTTPIGVDYVLQNQWGNIKVKKVR